MALPETTCPKCGQSTNGEHQCSAGAAPTEPGRWLEVGDTLQMGVEPQSIGIAHEADQLEIELEMTEMWETYQTRRVFLAHLLTICDEGQGALDETNLPHPDFVVEQEQAFEYDEHEVLPEELVGHLRRPLARSERGDKLVSLFSNDAGLALDEVVEVAAGRLNLAQVRGLFLPVLDAVANLHDRGLVHLRLAPWTLRVRDRADDKGLPLAFLRDTMDAPHDRSEPQTLGGEDTFSEVEEVEQVEETAGGFENEFAASRELEKTRDDLMPLAMAGFGSGDDANDETIDSSDSGVFSPGDLEAPLSDDAATELEVLFDNIEGFFEVHDDLGSVPIIRGFSPPEMMGRSASQVGPCCDVFNLGMLLYFLVAGQLPPVSVYTRHIPAVPARNLCPSFPPGLESVINRATRPDPQERYPDVESLREAFECACDLMQERAEASDSVRPQMRVAVDTHVGIAKARRNPVNQDAVFGKASDDGRFSLVVVADGVSTASYGSGDLASTMLIEEAESAWEDLLPSYLMDEPINPIVAIQDILSRANQRIVDYVNEHFVPFRGGPHEVMGSTALVAMLHDGMVTLAALGDSRVYLHRGGFFEQITIDHNLWTLSILEGVPADNALAMPHGDALARCLGTFVIEQERLEAVPPEPDVFQFSVTRGDTLLLTTDGLVDFAAANMLAAEDKIHQVLVSEPDPALACLELILLANRGGGGDNVGVGIVKFE